MLAENKSIKVVNFRFTGFAMRCLIWLSYYNVFDKIHVHWISSNV